MRPVDHPPVERSAPASDWPRTPRPPPGRGDLGLARRKAALITGLGRMDRHHAGEAVAPRAAPHRRRGPLQILEGGIDRLDRRHPGRRRAEQAERAGELVRRREAAVLLARRRGADRRRQILGAPGQAGEPLGPAIGAELRRSPPASRWRWRGSGRWRCRARRAAAPARRPRRRLRPWAARSRRDGRAGPRSGRARSRRCRAG